MPTSDYRNGLEDARVRIGSRRIHKEQIFLGSTENGELVSRAIRRRYQVGFLDGNGRVPHRHGPGDDSNLGHGLPEIDIETGEIIHPGEIINHERITASPSVNQQSFHVRGTDGCSVDVDSQGCCIAVGDRDRISRWRSNYVDDIATGSCVERPPARLQGDIEVDQIIISSSIDPQRRSINLILTSMTIDDVVPCPSKQAIPALVTIHCHRSRGRSGLHGMDHVVVSVPGINGGGAATPDFNVVSVAFLIVGSGLIATCNLRMA